MPPTLCWMRQSRSRGRQRFSTDQAHQVTADSKTPEPAAAPYSTSRAATDRLLGDLRAGGLQPRAWAQFLRAASSRSLRQATVRPGALIELTALHLALAVVRRKRGARGLPWIGCSWVLSVTHLGLLEQRRRVSLADVLTLTRANLPAVVPDARALVASAAVLTDVLDGPVARSLRTTTPFGRDADTLADAAFWTWFLLRHEPSPVLRALGLSVTSMRVPLVIAVSVARGRMVDLPRPRWLRPVAIVQGVVLAHALAPEVRCAARSAKARPEATGTGGRTWTRGGGDRGQCGVFSGRRRGAR